MNTEQENIPEQGEENKEAKDLFNVSSIFAKALAFILEDGQGIVIEMDHQLYNPVGESKRVAVINHSGMIRIENMDDEFEDGQCLEFTLSDEDNEEEKGTTTDGMYPEES